MAYTSMGQQAPYTPMQPATSNTLVPDWMLNAKAMPMGTTNSPSNFGAQELAQRMQATSWNGPSSNMIGAPTGSTQPYGNPAYTQQAPAYGLSGANAALGSPSTGTPAYGLSGANAALVNPYQGINIQMGSASQNLAPINQNRDMAIGLANNGIAAVDPYNQQGMKANDLQAAYSGALGQQAQQDAYNNFQSSPGQQWLQDQALRGVTRNAAAIGGLGGGNVMQELQRQAMGLAQQDFQNQYNNLGNVSDRGMQAAQLQNALYQNQGGYASSAGQQSAGIQAARIGAQASAQGAAANAATQIALAKAGYAFDSGKLMGDNYNSTTSALATLANQQGAGLSDMYGNYTGNIANLLTGGGGQQATSNQSLAGLLANINSGTQGAYVGASQVPGVQQSNGMLGNFGNALAGIGAGITGYNSIGVRS
jgi:hypothetical protein